MAEDFLLLKPLSNKFDMRDLVNHTGPRRAHCGGSHQAGSNAGPSGCLQARGQAPAQAFREILACGEARGQACGALGYCKTGGCGFQCRAQYGNLTAD
jgi:hypothetical protein